MRQDVISEVMNSVNFSKDSALFKACFHMERVNKIVNATVYFFFHGVNDYMNYDMHSFKNVQKSIPCI